MKTGHNVLSRGLGEQSSAWGANWKRLFGGDRRASKLLPVSVLAIFLILVVSIMHTPLSFGVWPSITFGIADIGSGASGTILTIDGHDYAYTDFPLPAFLWQPLSTHTINVPASSAGTGMQYVWSSWTNGDGLSGSSGTYTTPFSDVTVTVNYKLQYQLTMVTNFGTTDPSVGDHWYDEGSTVTISATAPTPGTGEQYVWNGWTGSGTGGSYTGTANPATNAVTMSGPVTETADWTHQYQLTIRTSGLSSSSYPTNVYLDGAIAGTAYDGSPFTQWFDENAPTGTIGVDDPVSGATGTQYVFQRWHEDDVTDNPRDPVTMTGPVTFTADYTTQYQVTFTSSVSDTTDLVVTVNGLPNYLIDLPYTDWYDSGSTINYAYNSPLGSMTVTDKQYAWLSTSGLGQSGQSATFTVTGTGTVTGTYKTQYYLTVDSAYDSPSGEGWHDSGSFISSTVLSPVSGGAGTQRVCTGWTGTGSAPHSGTGTSVGPFPITQPSSVTWNWKTQYSISFDSIGVGTDTGSATIVGVNGVNYRQSQLPYTTWYDDGSTIGYTFSSTVSGSPGRQYTYTSTSNTLGLTLSRTDSFTVSGGGTVIGHYNSAYTAAIVGASVNPDSSVQGSTITFRVTVRNTGTNNMAAQVRVNIYTPSDVWAASPVGVIPNFIVGTQRIVQVSYTTALTAPTGTWTYSVQVYYGTTLLDLLAHQTFTVNARSITGTISVTPPASVIRGVRVAFAVTVKNTGNVAWSGTIKIKISNGRGGVVTTLYLTTPNLDPSSSSYGPYLLYWLVPSTLATGSYTYTASLYYGTTQLDSKSGTITVSTP